MIAGTLAAELPMGLGFRAMNHTPSRPKLCHCWIQLSTLLVPNLTDAESAVVILNTTLNHKP